MGNSRKLVSVSLLLGLVFTASCGREEPKVREKSFLSVEEPVKVGELLHGALVFGTGGDWFMTAFLPAGFKSATEPQDAIAAFESKDAGATWAETSRISSFVSYGVWGYDLALGGDGALYLTWVCGVYEADNPQPFKAIMFCRSDDGRQSWTEPVLVNDLKKGQRWWPVMAVAGDNVYIAWLDERLGLPGRPAYQTVYFAASGDRGATWSADTALETALLTKDSNTRTPAICLGDDDAVYCAYSSLRRPDRNRGGSVGGCWVAKSADKGKTFTVIPAGIGPAGSVSVAGQGEKLYLAGVFGLDREIRLHVSTDGGEDWDELAIVNDDPGLSEKTNLTLVPLGQDRLMAFWDDTRGGVYAAASLDGGENWGKNIRTAPRTTVGNTPFDIATDRSSGTFAVLATDVRKGGGDAVYLAKGKIVP